MRQYTSGFNSRRNKREQIKMDRACFKEGMLVVRLINEMFVEGKRERGKLKNSGGM